MEEGTKDEDKKGGLEKVGNFIKDVVIDFIIALYKKTIDIAALTLLKLAALRIKPVFSS